MLSIVVPSVRSRPLLMIRTTQNEDEDAMNDGATRLQQAAMHLSSVDLSMAVRIQASPFGLSLGVRLAG